MKGRDPARCAVWSKVLAGAVGEEEGIAEALVIANSNLIGSTLKDMRFRQRYNVTVLAIRRGQELLRDRMGKVPLRFGDLLLVQGPKQSLVGIQTSRDLLLLEQRSLETYVQVKPTSPSPSALLSSLPLRSPTIHPGFSLAGVVAMILTGCLKPGELYQAVRWDVIFLLACLIPLGTRYAKLRCHRMVGQSACQHQWRSL